MSKVNIKSSLEVKGDNPSINNFDGMGILKDNVITFIDDKTKVKIVINKDSIKLNRSQNDYNLDMLFTKKKTKGNYKISQIGDLVLDITTNKIIIDINKFEIDYSLKIQDVDMGNFHYIVNYEVKE